MVYKTFRFRAKATGGEGGIRTHGPVLPGQHVSTVPLSTAQPPLLIASV